MKKKLLKKTITLGVAVIAAIAVFSGCGKKEDADMVKTDDLLDPLEGYTSYRPKRITLMADTCLTWEDGLKEFCGEYEAKTGIILEVKKPEHDKYYETVAKVLLSTDGEENCDVIEMGGMNYPRYAASGKLWDMSHAWEISNLNAMGTVDEDYINANKIDGKLYGFPIAKGKGTVTYVRNDILKKAGVAQPKNYNEFINMLRTFKANGVKYPLTAAGLVNSDTPYNIYMPEFYQGANPDFVKKDGKYVDGMTEPEMKAALQRMRDAFAEGLLDDYITKNGTSDARDKFYSGESACFNYWADWATKLNKNTVKKVPGAEVVPIEAIDECKYIERQSINFVVSMDKTGSEERRQGIFDYFIAYSHDGGDGQLLFTRGVEGVHWQMNGDKREMLGKMEKSYFDSTCSYVAGYAEHENIPVDDKVTYSLNVLSKKSEIAPLNKVTENTVDVVKEIADARKEAIDNIVRGNVTIDQGLADYQAKVGKKVAAALKEFNA